MVCAPPLPPGWTLALLLLSACIVSMASAVTVMGWVGQPVTLPCQYSVRMPSEVNPVCWGRGGCPMSQCSDALIQTDQTRVTWRKHERYQLQGALTSGDVSLTIMDANEGDSGTYCCRIDVPGWFNDLKNNIVLQMRRPPTTTTTTTTTTKTTTTPVPTTTTATTTTTTELTTTEAPTSVPTTIEQTTLSTIITTISPTADVITPTTFTTAITTTVITTPVISTISDTTPIIAPTTTPTAAPAISPATEPKTTSITTTETTDANALSSTSINASTNEMKHTPTNIPSTMYRTKVTSTVIDAQTVADLITASTFAPTTVSSATVDINIPTEYNITQSSSVKAPTLTTPTVMSSNNTQTTPIIPIISTGAPVTERGLTMTVHSMVSNATGTEPAFNFTKTPAPLTSFITTAVISPGTITTPVITTINEPNATRTPNTSHTARIINSTEPLPTTWMMGTLSSDDTEKAMTPTERADIWTMETPDLITEYSTEITISKTNESSLGDQMPIKSTSLLSSSSLIAVVCSSVALCVLILLFGLRVRSKIWNKYHLDKTERFWADGRPVEMFNGTLQERDENIFTL